MRAVDIRLALTIFILAGLPVLIIVALFALS
jgi:hypothetical protein